VRHDRVIGSPVLKEIITDRCIELSLSRVEIKFVASHLDGVQADIDRRKIFVRSTALSTAFGMSTFIAMALAQAEDVAYTAIANGNFNTLVTDAQAAD
jgi:hypothetical protein